MSTNDASVPTRYVSLLDTVEAGDQSLTVERSPLTWSRTWQSVREWSSKTLEYTRLLFQERFGHLQRTEDIHIEQNIQFLNETKQRYERILFDAQQMSIHFSGLIQSQRSFGQSLIDIQRLSSTSDDLVDEIVRNSLCQTVLANNGQPLLNSLNTFIEKLQTFISKTIEDTLMSIKTYENARLEYDVYRSEFQRTTTQDGISTVALTAADEQIQRKHQHLQQRYEKAKNNLTVKFQLLNDHRIEVMRQQLLNFQTAISTYFTMNRQQLNL